MKSELEERFDSAVNKAVEIVGGMERCYGNVGDITARGNFLARVEEIAEAMDVEFTELSEVKHPVNSLPLLQISYQKSGQTYHCNIPIPVAR